MNKYFFFLGIFIFITIQKGISKEKKDSTSFSINPAFDFDQRFSAINNKFVNIWGYRIGLMMNEKYKIGIGGYFMKNQISSTQYNVTNNDILYNRIMYFGTIYFEPFLIRRKLWETSIVSEIGYGSYHLTPTNQLNSIIKNQFIPSGIGLSISFKLPEIYHFKPMTWIGFNFSGGYRKILFENTLNTHYDGFYWSTGLAIFLDKVIKDIKYRYKKK